MKAILRKTVLVVDDDLMVRLLITSLLQEQGYAVRQASSGASGLLMLGSAADDIDLVLADLQMPGMSGLDFALHARRMWPDIPVAVMTARAPVDLPPDEVAGIPLVPKPFVPEVLFAVLDSLTAVNNPA